MSWLFSQALVEVFSEENFLDGEQSAPLNGNLTQQAYCAPDKMTAFSRLSRFGMTYKPLTESRGEELLTLYLAGFRAKTLAQQEKAQELMESAAECGERWRASFARYDPDTCSWKTAQCSLLGGLDEFSETWPQWGLMRDGECWEQRTLEQTIRETEFGLKEKQECLIVKNVGGNLKQEELQDLVAQGAGQHNQKLLKWPTPRSCSAMAATITPESAWNEKRNPNLETIVGQRLWPTPKVQDSRHAKMRHLNQSDDHWKSNLGEVVSAQVNGGNLNPTWTEWLMGWPLEWTDLKPLEMDKSHCALQPLGES